MIVSKLNYSNLFCQFIKDKFHCIVNLFLNKVILVVQHHGLFFIDLCSITRSLLLCWLFYLVRLSTWDMIFDLSSSNKGIHNSIRNDKCTYFRRSSKTLNILAYFLRRSFFI